MYDYFLALCGRASGRVKVVYGSFYSVVIEDLAIWGSSIFMVVNIWEALKQKLFISA